MERVVADLAFATATEQAELVRRREVSPMELVEKYPQYRERLPQGPFVVVEIEERVEWRASG